MVINIMSNIAIYNKRPPEKNLKGMDLVKKHLSGLMQSFSDFIVSRGSISYSVMGY